MTAKILAIAAWSGTGKTTLLQKVIPLLKKRGIRVGLIKHTHHDVDIDTPGKDSYVLRKAGADQVIVASSQRWALMCENADTEEFDLNYLVSRMDTSKLDLVLVEGFKNEAVPKIVLWREGIKESAEALTGGHVIAVAGDGCPALHVPVLNISRPDRVADFIAGWLAGR